MIKIGYLKKNKMKDPELYTPTESIIYQEPKHCNLNRQSIEDYTEKILKISKFKTPDKIDNLVEQFGGKVIYYNYGDWISKSKEGTTIINKKHDFIINMQAETSPIRDRYVIAHSLSHYFLHSQQETPMRIFRGFLDKQINNEAHIFAQTLLMPKIEFQEKLQEYKEKYKNQYCLMLAGHFDIYQKYVNQRGQYL
jgi:Zn-dependent peptidase ImmA (M78 family)